jgi:hypothetical protein
MKFHVTENGPKMCSAMTTAKCPYGSEENSHFEDFSGAAAEYESRMEGSLLTTKRSAQPAQEVFQEDYERTDSVYEHGEIVDVEDSGGDVHEVRAGVLDEDTQWLFMNGQCLALATELSKELGSDQMFTIYHEEEGDILWDEENNEPLLDEDGDEQYETVQIPFHVMAMDNQGNLWDVMGKTQVQDLVLDEEHKTVTHSVNGTLARFEGFLSNQNYNFARSFSSTILNGTQSTADPENAVVSA